MNLPIFELYQITVYYTKNVVNCMVICNEMLFL